METVSSESASINTVPAADPTTPTSEIDGRRARRERGREAVTDAMVDLVFEGHVSPTAEQIVLSRFANTRFLPRHLVRQTGTRRHEALYYQQRIR